LDPGTIIPAVSLFWFASEVILARMKRSGETDAQLDKSSLRILWITILVSIGIGIYVSDQEAGHMETSTRVLPFAGVILIVAGLIVRWIAILSLKHQFTVDVSIRKDHRIIDKGIYSIVRHPAYAGSLLSFFGLAICFSNYLTMYIIFVPICLAFLHRIDIEEEALRQAFGSEYVDYCRWTKRLVPWIY